ncbi:MAG: UDP-N-acetylglucosamine 1-carboxyvinyltransferase [Defluviitaleaceae bacterium]|nr:UDP-N-acetylglucosamine 1-carboxyvinyltransferase [Defluviitaleaceae bacterium]
MERFTEQIVIAGKNRLSGKVSISGAKNAALAIIPAALCSEDTCIIENLPDIKDVSNFVGVIRRMGASCEFTDKNKSTIRINAKNLEINEGCYEALKDMRASYYLIGAFLGRYGYAEIPLPGGCNFGQRPIDQHIKGFEALGANVVVEHGLVRASAKKLTGAHVYLDVASVGATINIMLAAVYAEGTTTIENAAKEPHIVDCANFLNMCGASIKGAGTDVIRINGVESLGGCQYTIIPDQIETGTYLIAGAISGGDITVCNVIPKHMDALTAKLIEMGCQIEEGDDSIRIISNLDRLTAVNVKTLYYPGFPTDLQPQMTALLLICKGTSFITETVFVNRFQYVDQIMRLGAKIKIDGRMAVVEGPSYLTGTEVVATDLRAGASLVIAALAAEGITRISNIKYIDRGYENLEDKLFELGANIRRVRIPEKSIKAEKIDKIAKVGI